MREQPSHFWFLWREGTAQRWVRGHYRLSLASLQPMTFSMECANVNVYS